MCIYVGLGAPSAHQPDTTSHPRSDGIHPAVARHHHGRRSALWLYLHPAILHPELALVLTDVLHVRFPVPSVHYPRNHLLGDDDTALLLPSVRRGLPLVVAIIFNLGLHRCLLVFLLLSLFHHETIDRRRCLDILVFRLHSYHGILIQSTYRHHRFLCMFLVHP